MDLHAEKLAVAHAFRKLARQVEREKIVTVLERNRAMHFGGADKVLLADTAARALALSARFDCEIASANEGLK